MTEYNNAIIVFARKPELGKVKTRLAASVGEQKALDIYLKLLSHTKEVVREVYADCFIFLTAHYQDDFWQNNFIELQNGESLGEKMQHAFETIFKKQYQKCLIVGSDCPKLSSTIIEEAFEALSGKDVVIGPATDGGYYLLGMKKYRPTIFENIEWSTANVFRNTLKNVSEQNLQIHILEMLSDVDELEDVPKDWL